MEIISHLRDVEREVNLPRIQTFLREENPFITADDTDLWVAERGYATQDGKAVLEDFIEAKLLVVSDPWPDKNAVEDGAKLGIPVVAFCDTNNEVNNVDLVIPCNNKGKKSLAILYWILAKEYMKLKGMIKSDEDFKYSIDDFTAE